MFNDNDSTPLLTTGELPPELIAAIDHAAALAPGRPGRSEMIVHILSEWLRAKGHLRQAGADEGTRPEDLTSENDD